MSAVKFITGVGYVDATCPTDLWPDKSCIWLRGFAEGWNFARTQPISVHLPIYQGELARGFSFGMSQYAIRTPAPVLQ